MLCLPVWLYRHRQYTIHGDSRLSSCDRAAGAEAAAADVTSEMSRKM